MNRKFRVTVNGQTYDVVVEEIGGSAPMSAPAVQVAPIAAAVQSAPVAAPVGGSAGPGSIKAPMPGTILAVKVTKGQAVKRGDVLCILEAMKMENEITAPNDGVVQHIRVQAGTTVNTGDPLIDLA